MPRGMVLEKIESLGVTAGGDLLFANDNDGVDGYSAETKLIRVWCGIRRSHAQMPRRLLLRVAAAPRGREDKRLKNNKETSPGSAFNVCRGNLLRYWFIKTFAG